MLLPIQILFHEEPLLSGLTSIKWPLAVTPTGSVITQPFLLKSTARPFVTRHERSNLLCIAGTLGEGEGSQKSAHRGRSMLLLR